MPSYLVQLQTHLGDWVDVGLLQGQNNTNWFETFGSYWSLPERPVLGQIFEEYGPTWRPSARVAIPHWFSQLLPEGRLREAVSRASTVNVRDELPLIGLLGSADLPGALRLLPATDDAAVRPPAHKDDVDEYVDTDPVLKFSLAGMQLKFSMRSTDRGLTLPASGDAGDVIVKLPDGRVGFEHVPEAEYSAMRLAQAAGYEVPRIELVGPEYMSSLGRWAYNLVGNSYMIARYDRISGGRRVHAEEFAQILNIAPHKVDSKYRYTNFEAVANIAAKLVGLDAVREVIQRIVLNVLVGNGDAHLKNWSIVYPDSKVPKLSPLYDVVPTVLYVDGDNLGLNLNGSKVFEAVTPSSFGRIGRVTGFGEGAAARVAEDAAARVRDNWSVLREPLPHTFYEALTERLKSLNL